ncbi:MAG TPA: GTPase Era [Gemmatimonadales bacterium]|nr:GTPase Era [Gemmatimonadales bacterium]
MTEPKLPPTRSGHVALAGAPNVGKSTLLNRLVGAHLAIVSPKAQSTRLPVLGLVSDATTQIVLHDLPGLLDPGYLLQSRMRAAGLAELARVDLVLHLHPASAAPAPDFWSLAGTEPRPIPVLTVYTKSDLADQTQLGRLPEGSFPVSAETGSGIDQLLNAIRRHLPERPFEFAEDDLGTQPLRFFVTEYLREAAFGALEDEVPYGVAAEVEEFRENAAPVYIRVTLLVERESQKGIVIGKGGRTLKAIGQHARQRLEDLLGAQVFLDLWVKVLPNWRRDAAALDRLGFPPESAAR